MAATLVLRGRPGPIPGPAGKVAGHLSAITWAANRLVVEGRLEGAGDLTLRLGEMRAQARLPAGGGAFALALPWPPGLALSGTTPDLVLDDAPPLPLPLGPVRRRQAALALRLGGTLLRLTPDLGRWILRQDRAARARVKEALGLGLRPTAGPLEAAVFAPPEEAAPADSPGPLTLVLPVYNAFDLLQDCLDRVVRHTPEPWRMVVVEDGSPDARIRPALRAFAAARPEGQVTLIEAPQNRGFIASVNAAFAEVLRRPADRTGPVVLLNSDALLPPGWAPRLLAPLADPGVASVTPMSNDAEIFTAPVLCAPAGLAPGQALAMDAVARRLDPAHARAEAPTGVGFCMALQRRFLDLVPRFDTAFGRGYGEEVDWCQKVRAQGGRHLGIATLVVEHRGGASFGSAEKQALILANNARITRRYPAYDDEVQAFLTSDPLRSARMALALAWAGSLGRGPVPVYLAHAMGGGAESWLQHALPAALAEAGAAVVLRVGGAVRWQLDLVTPQGRVSGWTGDFALIERLLAPLARRRILYSCGVGDPDPVSLPGHLLALARSPQDEVEILFHDFFPMSPAFTLLGSDGRFHGAPRPGTPDPAHQARRPDGGRVPLADWQQAWGALVARADRLRVFSASGADLVAQTWPEARPRISLDPHQLPHRPPRLDPPAPGPRPVLAALGNIAPHKGAGLLQALGRMSAEARGFDLVLIGNLDPGYSLPRSVPVHGDYSPADIPTLARHYRISHWLIPSLWPETFSFTTHEALATGLPVLAFALGAQGDAVASAENGIALPHDPAADPAEAVLAALRPPAPAGQKAPSSVGQAG